MSVRAFTRRMRESVEGFRTKRMLEALRTTRETEWLRLNETLTLKAFRRAAREVPAYRSLLSQHGVDPAQILTLQDFRARAPLLDKAAVFEGDIAEWCRGGDLSEVKSFLTSSGQSGIFAYGVNTHENLRRSASNIDMGLEAYFDISRYRTLLVNALPMGVKVHTRLAIAETSVRGDMALAVIRKFVPPFEQAVIVGEGAFLKKLAEDGAKAGIDWPKRRSHWIAGEEGIAENWRSYLAHLTGTEIGAPGQPFIGSSMGVAELDLNLFHETPHTVRIRRWAHADAGLRAALFGSDARVCPMLFISYPHRTFLETLPSPGEATGEPGELVVTMLSPDLKLPLLRYRTGDRARLLGFSEVDRILRERGYQPEPGPELPLLAVYGRGAFVLSGGERVTPEMVKEGLYARADVASRLTANFHMSGDGEGVRLDFQLRRGVSASEPLAAALREDLSKYIPVAFALSLTPYADFRWNIGIDYERKFDYLGGNDRA